MDFDRDTVTYLNVQVSNNQWLSWLYCFYICMLFKSGDLEILNIFLIWHILVTYYSTIIYGHINVKINIPDHTPRSNVVLQRSERCQPSTVQFYESRDVTDQVQRHIVKIGIVSTEYRAVLRKSGRHWPSTTPLSHKDRNGTDQVQYHLVKVGKALSTTPPLNVMILRGAWNIASLMPKV